MERRALGRTEMNVSVIGFGGIPIQKLSLPQAETVLNRALDLGINFFDTARGYTDSEEKIGRAIAHRRQEYYLASKSLARTGEEMHKDIETSLRNLRTDYIDLYQIHALPSAEVMELMMTPGGGYSALVEAQEAGKIRFIGVTGHLQDVLQRAVETGLFDTVQHPFNPIETEWAANVIPVARENGVGLIGMKPVAGGALGNVPAALRFELTGILRVDDKIDAAADGGAEIHHPDPHRYIPTDPPARMDMVIPGMDTIEQVEQNAAVGTGLRPPDSGEAADLEADIERWQGSFCRRCGYCVPCPEGLNIPFLLLIQAYYTRYDLPDWSLDRLAGLDKKYADCKGCGHCQELCPYQLDIPALMSTAEKQVI